MTIVFKSKNDKSIGPEGIVKVENAKTMTIATITDNDDKFVKRVYSICLDDENELELDIDKWKVFQLYDQ